MAPSKCVPTCDIELMPGKRSLIGAFPGAAKVSKVVLAGSCAFLIVTTLRRLVTRQRRSYLVDGAMSAYCIRELAVFAFLKNI